MSDTYNYDLVVIGSGPGGYVAAIRAAQLGLKTCVVEKEHIGGICLNWGCIPSKSLIKQAKVFASIKELEQMGISVDATGFNYEHVHKKSRTVAERLSKGVAFLLNKNKIELVTGQATVKDPHTVVIDSKDEITTKNILLATGSRSRAIPGFDIDEDSILSSTGVLSMTGLPKSIIILGAGAIGLEFAYVLSTFGVQVQVVEMLDQLLPTSDKEVTDVVGRLFRRKKIKVHLGTKALSYTKTDTGLELVIENKKGQSTLTAEKILVAVGRMPNSDGLGLENAGVKVEKGFVTVGDYYQTAVESIYAIGDVINTPLLAHVASKEGEIAVEHMAGHETEKAIPFDEIPYGVYCEPQIAGFGLTEQAAADEGIAHAKAVFPYRAIGKAVAIDETDGVVKIIYKPDTTEILGAHIVGAEATELIHEILLAKRSELGLEEIANMIHAHPTLSESMMEAAKGAFDGPIHI